MKRFYCVTCKRVKRVRKYPRNIQNVESVNVAERRGVCNSHSDSHTSINYSVNQMRKVRVS